MSTPNRRQSKTLILSVSIGKKLVETEFSIAICCPTGNKWQLKNTVSSDFDPRLSIFKSVFVCRLSGVMRVPGFSNLSPYDLSCCWDV